MSSAKAAIGAFVLVAVVTGTALYPLCAVLHRCGCVAPWNGGVALCNVHQPGPHCPWCEYPALGAIALLVILAVQGLVFWRLWKPRRSLVTGLAAAVLALGPALLASGGLLWLLTDYPHFLARDARGRLGVPPGPLQCGTRPSLGPACCVKPR